MTLLAEAWAEERETGLHAADIGGVNGSQWEKKKKKQNKQKNQL